MSSTVPEECKRFIRSVLLSKVGGIRIENFQKDYKNLIGKPLKFFALGYKSLLELIEDMPDVARIKIDEQGNKTIFGILDNPNIMNHTAKKAQYIPDETPEKRKLMWSEQLIPNLKGLYCLVIPKTRELSREKANQIFSHYGTVAEMSVTERYIFARYQDKNEALNALEHLRKTYDVRIPEERDDPRKVVKQKDVSGELPAYPKIVAKKSSIAGSAGENDQLEVFIGNLPLQTNEFEVRQMLKDFEILNVRMKGNPDDGKRFGFILVSNVEEGEKISTALHRTTFNGRTLVVQISYKNVQKRPALEDQVILDSMKRSGVQGTEVMGSRLADLSNETTNDEDFDMCATNSPNHHNSNAVTKGPPGLEKFILSSQKSSIDGPPGLEQDKPPGLELIQSPNKPKQHQRYNHNSPGRKQHHGNFAGLESGNQDTPPGLKKIRSSDRPKFENYTSSSMKQANGKPPGLEAVNKDKHPGFEQRRSPNRPNLQNSDRYRYPDRPPGLESVKEQRYVQQTQDEFSQKKYHKGSREQFQDNRNPYPGSPADNERPPGLEKVNTYRQTDYNNRKYGRQYREHADGPPGLENVDSVGPNQRNVRQQSYYQRSPHKYQQNFARGYSRENQSSPPDRESQNRRPEYERNNNVKDHVYIRPNIGDNGPPPLVPADMPDLEKLNLGPQQNLPKHSYGRNQYRSDNFRRGAGDYKRHNEREKNYHHSEEGDNNSQHIQDSERFELYVANFPFGTTEDDLMEVFEAYGAVFVKMKNNQPPYSRDEYRHSKTFCFVVFANYDDASEAFTNLDGEKFYGRPLEVSFGRRSIVDEKDLVKKVGNFQCTVTFNEGGSDNDTVIIDRTINLSESINKEHSQRQVTTPADNLQTGNLKNGNHVHLAESRKEQQKRASSNIKKVTDNSSKSSVVSKLKIDKRERQDSWETMSESSLPSISSGPGSSVASPHVAHTSTSPPLDHPPQNAEPVVASNRHVEQSHGSRHQSHIPESMRIDKLKGFMRDCFKNNASLTKASDLPEIVQTFVRISEGNGYFWGQLVRQDEVSDFSKTIEDMLKVSELESAGMLLPYEYSSKRAAVLFEGEWYRVWVEACVEDQTRVFFVDWGNTETMHISNLRILPDELWSRHPLAIPFKLQGHSSLGDLINERIDVKVLNSTSEGIMEFEIIEESTH